jgi:hypothetical protein
MDNRSRSRYLEMCLQAVEASVEEERTIYKIEMGKPRFGRQTFLTFRVSTGILSAAGDAIEAGSEIDHYLMVNVDPPHASLAMRPAEFVPYGVHDN